jgi:hypothetical protein
VVEGSGAENVTDLLTLGLGAGVRSEAGLAEAKSAAVTAELQNLDNAALVGREAGDLTDNRADDLVALGGLKITVRNVGSNGREKKMNREQIKRTERTE